MKNTRNHKTAYQYHIKENGKRKEITKENVDRITLDNGTGILEIHGDSTIINNYLGVFWKSILGVRNFSILHSLVMHTFGDKNQSWLSRKTIAEENGIKDVKTVDTAIEELEDKGFVRIVYVFNADNNTNESNTYIIRRTTPFISLEQYNKLSKNMKERHDEFIQKLITSGRANVSNIPDYGSTKLGDTGNNLPSGNFPLPPKNPLDGENELQNDGISDISPSGKFPLPEKIIPPSGKIPLPLVENFHPNKNNLEEKQKNNIKNIKRVNSVLKQGLENQLPKNTFDTWISPCEITQMSNGVVYWKCPNEFCREWTEDRFKDQIIELLVEIGIDFQVINFYT